VSAALKIPGRGGLLFLSTAPIMRAVNERVCNVKKLAGAGNSLRLSHNFLQNLQ